MREGNEKILVAILVISFAVSFLNVIPFANASGSLLIYTRNRNGAAVVGTSVKLFSYDYSTLVSTQTSYDSGYVYWSYLSDSQYNIEVRYRPGVGLNYEEYWGGDTYSTPGTYNFYRHTQAITDIWINGQSLWSSNVQIDPNQNIHVDIQVKNDESSAKNTYVWVALDKSQSASFDHSSTSSIQSISANGYRTYGFDFAPSSSGTYYLYAVVRGQYPEGYLVTDQLNWYSAFTVNEPMGNLYAYVTNADDDYHSVQVELPGYTQTLGINAYSSATSVVRQVTPGINTVTIRWHDYDTNLDYSKSNNYYVSSGQTLQCSFTVDQHLPPVGSLRVYVRNFNDELVPNAEVRLLGLPPKTTEAGGYADFSNLPYGDYNLEVRYQPGVALNLEEYWGGQSVTISSSSSTVNFIRHTQRVESISIDGVTDDSWPIEVDVNEPVSVSFTVRNDESSAKNAYVQLYLDKSQSPSCDFKPVSATKSIAAYSSSVFTFSFTPTQTGVYYLAAAVYGQYPEGYIPTDQNVWTSALNVGSPVGSLRVYVRNFNDELVPNAEVQLLGLPPKTTEAGGYVDFFGLPYGDYNMEVRYQPGVALNLEEYWGGQSVTISSSSSTVNFIRHTQRVESISIDGVTDDSWPIEVNFNDPALISVTVRNDESSAKNARVKLILDKSQSIDDYDFEETSLIHYIGSGSTSVFSFSFNPPEPGTYYLYAIVQGDYPSGYLETDQYCWNDAVEGLTASGSKGLVSFSFDFESDDDPKSSGYVSSSTLTTMQDIIDLLNSNDVDGTIFVQGACIDNEQSGNDFSDIISSANVLDFEIGSHSYTHPDDINSLSLSVIDEEIVLTNECLLGITGKVPLGFRAPYFSVGSNLLNALSKQRYFYDSSEHGGDYPVPYVKSTLFGEIAEVQWRHYDDDGTVYSIATNSINDAVSLGNNVVLVFHPQEVSSHWEEFQDLINLVVSLESENLIEVKTLYELAETVLEPILPLSAEAACPSSGDVNEPVQFTGSASGGIAPYSYFWNFGGGASSTIQNPSFTFDSTGSYTVTLDVTDSGGWTTQAVCGIQIDLPPPKESLENNVDSLTSSLNDFTLNSYDQFVDTAVDFTNRFDFSASDVLSDTISLLTSCLLAKIEYPNNNLDDDMVDFVVGSLVDAMVEGELNEQNGEDALFDFYESEFSTTISEEFNTDRSYWNSQIEQRKQEFLSFLDQYDFETNYDEISGIVNDELIVYMDDLKNKYQFASNEMTEIQVTSVDFVSIGNNELYLEQYADLIAETENVKAYFKVAQGIGTAVKITIGIFAIAGGVSTPLGVAIILEVITSSAVIAAEDYVEFNMAHDAALGPLSGMFFSVWQDYKQGYRSYDYLLDRIENRLNDLSPQIMPDGLISEFSAENVYRNNQGTISLTFENIGEVDVTATSYVEVYSSDNSLVGAFTDCASVVSGDQMTFSFLYDYSKVDEYTVYGKVDYSTSDGLASSTDFSITNFSVDFENEAVLESEVITSGVLEEHPFDPVDSKTVFYSDDSKVMSWAKFDYITAGHIVRWEWFDPEQNLYYETEYVIEDPHVSGYDCFEWFKTWSGMYIANNPPASMNGEWTVKIYLDDSLVETQIFEILASEDTTPPSVPDPDDGILDWSSIDTPTFSWSISSDSESGVDGYYWRVDEQSETWTTSTSVTLTVQSDGVHTFYVKAVDNAGNPSGYGEHVFQIDASIPVAPTITSLTHSNEDDWFENNDPQFSWNTPEDVSGISGFSYVFDQESLTSPSQTIMTTDTSVSYSDVIDGEWYFHIRARDEAENWGDVAHYRVRIQTTQEDLVVPTDGMVITQNTKFVPGTYDLPNGITVAASDVVLDGNGATLNGVGTQYVVGIETVGTLTNVEIKNCIVQNYWDGIIVHALDSSIKDNTVTYFGHVGISVSGADQSIVANNEVAGYSVSPMHPQQRGIGVGSSYCEVFNNTVSYCLDKGFMLSSSSQNNNIYNNTAMNINYYGFYLYESDYNSFSNNLAKYNGRDGFYALYTCDQNVFFNNTIINNGRAGIFLDTRPCNNIIYNNTLSENQIGIFLQHSTTINNIVKENEISNNIDKGVYTNGLSNVFYHNNFLDNTIQAVDDSEQNIWQNYDLLEGNYWSDYSGDDLDDDGIGDDSYIVNNNNQDYYPLITPWIYSSQKIFQYDFGTSDSVVESDYVKVTQSTVYTPSLGYGWLSTSGLSSRDRLVPDSLMCDLVQSTTDNIFNVDLENGEYQITITVGDNSYAHDNIDIHAEDVQRINDLTTNAGDFQTESFWVSVTDGQLNIVLHDDGGSDGNWVINALTVEAGVAPLSVSILPTSVDLMVGQSQLFTATAFGGTEPYTYQWYVNDVVVEGEILSTFTFTPESADIYEVYVIVTDDNSDTAQSNTATVTVTAAPLFAFDFGTSGSLVEDGYTQVTESTVYSVPLGYGWTNTAGLSSRDRGAPNDLNRDLVQSAKDNTFNVDLEPNVYHVVVGIGDQSYGHDNIDIYAEDIQQSNDLTVNAGEFQIVDFYVTVIDGQLNILIHDDGGSDGNWVINSLTIEEIATPLLVNIIPESATLTVGESQLFTTIAFSGTEPYTYQWYVNDVVVNGETLSTFTFTPESADTYDVYVIVTDDDSTTAQSNTAAVDVSDAPLWEFDFGTSGSPTETGYTQVTEATQYTGLLDYGWVITSGLGSRDRGEPDDLTRDLVQSTTDHTFNVDLENGEYLITLTIGDNNYDHDYIDIFAEGVQQINDLNANAGEFQTVNFWVSVTDGQLNIIFSDDGGSDGNWVVNALTIATGVAPLSVRVAPTTADLMVGQSQLFTATAFGGVEPYAYQWYVNDVVVEGETTSTFTFTPASANTYEVYVIVTDDNSDTAQSNTATATVTAAPLWAFDFGTSGSPVEVGYTQVTESTQYTGLLDYGWATASGLSSRDRGAPNNLNRDLVQSTTDHTFNVDLENGEYQITITLGDNNYLHDNIDVYAEDIQQADDLTVDKGDFQTVSFWVSVTDGQLNVVFHDDGGSDVNWVINALTIETDV